MERNNEEKNSINLVETQIYAVFLFIVTAFKVFQ